MKPEARARALFTRAWGAEPAAVASAPGRVNLIGEHVDYHGGHVLPVGTVAHTAVAVGPATGRLRAVSESAPAVEHPWPATPARDWSDYVAGPATVFDAGSLPWAGGLCVAVAGDLPMGAGLGSSAALGVAATSALARWAGRSIDRGTLADIAWRAETEFVGVPCGRMDQLAAAWATPDGALLIDCRSLATEEIPFGLDIVIVDSGEGHALRASAYAERRREGEEALAILRARAPSIESLVDIPPARLPALVKDLPPRLGRRVRHVVNENQRTLLAARALQAGDDTTFSALVNASHDSLRDLYECSTPRLDAIVVAARALTGVLGARLVGAGWGGSVLVVAERGAGDAVAAALGGTVGL